MNKFTIITIGLTTILITTAGLVGIIIGGGGGWPQWGDKGESFIYMTEPVSKITDSTESSRKLVEFTKREFLTKEVVKVDENIYVAIGWALANCIMIEGDDGLIIVDTTESPDSMKEIMVEFRKISTKPVKAVIFTHFHTDHNIGTSFIVEEERKLHPNNTVEIYSHELTKTLMFGFSDTYDIGFTRGLRQLGVILPVIPGAETGGGIGPFLRISTSSQLYIPTPTVTFTDRATYNIAGVEVELIHTPGETDDQITVWLPKQKAILPGDNIYKTFPNLYAIRGSPARDSLQWYRSIDKLRQLGAKYIVGSHTKPVEGEQAVDDALLVYRDGIKFVHDQTVRLLNKGYFPTQIVDQLRLPDNLDRQPHMQQHYGNVPWSVRGVFANYLGWFSGNPRDLHPMTDGSRASRLFRLVAYAQTQNFDPLEVMLQDAQIAHNSSHVNFLATGKHISDDDKWALELADLVLEMKPDNENLTKVAKLIKISALRALGVEEISANGRNYYLTNAMELEYGISIQRTKSAIAYVVKTSSIDRVLGILCSKVDGLTCQNKNYTMRFTFTDVEKEFAVTLRNSVCDVIEPAPMDTVSQFHLSTTTETFKSIGAEDENVSIDTEIGLGTATVISGKLETYKEFIACFDPLTTV